MISRTRRARRPGPRAPARAAPGRARPWSEASGERCGGRSEAGLDPSARVPAGSGAPRSRSSAWPGPPLRSPRSADAAPPPGGPPHFRPAPRQERARDAACAAPRRAGPPPVPGARASDRCGRLVGSAPARRLCARGRAAGRVAISGPTPAAALPHGSERSSCRRRAPVSGRAESQPLPGMLRARSGLELECFCLDARYLGSESQV